jgi:light-regulated signal transduction histidine kinase (bacteriophytochrome)
MNDSNSVPRADGAAPTVLPGQVDLSNCDREAIHLCGAIQPHAALLVVREPDLIILQASEITGSFLCVSFVALLG